MAHADASVGVGDGPHTDYHGTIGGAPFRGRRFGSLSPFDTPGERLGDMIPGDGWMVADMARSRKDGRDGT
jgi:hypothetical protein